MYWELERCLNAPECPLDRDTVNNLRFLIGLRHEIEHEMIMNLDNWLSGRYQACAINYCEYINKLFGEDQGLEQFLSYSLQFVKLSREQAEGMPIDDDIPARLKSYIAEFDAQLSPTEYNSPSFAYRLFFTPKAAGKIGQADSVVEFVPLGSSESDAIVERSLVVKEVERPKFLPSEIVRQMRAEGFVRFNLSHHATLWRSRDAKKAGKGYGVQVGSTWYWYERWLDVVRAHCREQRNLFS